MQTIKKNRRKRGENTATLYSFLLAALMRQHPTPSCMSTSDTNIESSLGIRLLPKLSQEMVEQANYLTGNIIHFKTCLWGTLWTPECLKKERGTH